jgi:hypothetical protein
MVTCPGSNSIRLIKDLKMGGTGKGLDTALVLRPANSQDFFDLKVKEILCKPHF